MKNIVINGTEYSDISSIVVQTADGTTAEFKDIDEVSSMTVETLSFNTFTDLHNKLKECIELNPNFKVRFEVSGIINGGGFGYSVGEVDVLTSRDVLFESGCVQYLNLETYTPVAQDGSSDVFAFSTLSPLTRMHILIRINETSFNCTATMLVVPSAESFGLTQGTHSLTTEELAGMTFTFYY